MMNKDIVRECLKGILGYIELVQDSEVNEYSHKIACEAVKTIARETGLEVSINAYIVERISVRERQKRKASRHDSSPQFKV
ncbi:MAG: hypothetical protein IKF61_02990 [Firmicutes bacterium]|nr:hypothetical protein [Bacillota bacterium]